CLQPPQKKQNHENQKYDPYPPAGIVSPRSAVRPSGKTAEHHDQQNDHQNKQKHRAVFPFFVPGRLCDQCPPALAVLCRALTSSLSSTPKPLLNACGLIVWESWVSFSSVSFSSFNVCFNNEEASLSPSNS